MTRVVDGGAVVALLGLASLLAPWWWVTDLVASAGPLVGVLGLLTLALGLAIRRWWAASSGLVVVGVVAFLAITSRAPRGPVADWTLLELNGASGAHRDPLSILDGIREADADLCVLVEIPAPLVRAIREGALDDLYPTRLERRPTKHEASWIMVLSRFEGDALPDEDLPPGLLVSDLEIREVPVRLIAFQATSPRSLARWRDGHRIVDAARAAIAGPTIGAGDLNATPTGGRSRRLGLGRATPLLSRGTYPSWSPVGLSIDDVFVSDDFRIASWRTLDLGSDHRAILVGIGMPGE
ncbi:MAG: endonuclease/exonuclease/phosphatase family protein [Phycisphaerales bacterium]|nr:endonuclease/exonuclease/phosphatase family protein [Phycisphaerales bacterium]